MELLDHYYNETDGYPVTDEGKKILLNELNVVCQNFSLNEEQKTLYNNYKNMIENAKSLSYLQQEFANGVTKAILMISLEGGRESDLANFIKLVALSLELKADELINSSRDK